MRAACEPGFPTATDLADWVVRVLKEAVPRGASHRRFSIVKIAEEKGMTLDKLPLADMQTVEPAITAEVFKVLSPEASGAFAHEPGRHRAGPGEGTAQPLAGSSEMRKLIILAAVAIALAGCGVKNDLVKPNGQATPRDEQNPSKPPYPLGR